MTAKKRGVVPVLKQSSTVRNGRKVHISAYLNGKMVSQTVLDSKTRLKGLFKRKGTPDNGRTYHAILRFYLNGEYRGECYVYDENDITDAWDAIFDNHTSARLKREERAFRAELGLDW